MRRVSVQEGVVQERQKVEVQLSARREVESLLAVGSALAWGALAVSLWSFVEHSRYRCLRHRVSDRLLAQVFPVGRLD